MSKMTPINSKIFWIVFWFIAFSYVITKVFYNYLPSNINNILNYIGVYWMGIMLYLLLVFPLIDIFRLINNKVGIISNSTTILTNLAVSLMGLFFIGIIIYGTYQGKNSHVAEYNVSIDKDVESLEILMISDIHLGDIIGKKRLENTVKEINALNPDIVFIPGDIIDGNLQYVIDNKMIEEFKNIKSKYGVYASLGNHDVMTKKIEELKELLKEANVNLLLDEVNLINNSFYVVGRNDPSIKRYNGSRKPLNEIIKNIDKTKPIFLIDHQPTNLNEAVHEEIDIQVSGHTHKGQLLPLNLITNSIFEIDHGYLKKENSNIIVSSGYGTWGPPLRLGSRSEIVLIKVNK